MAYADALVEDNGYITIKISGLQYQAKLYDEFKATVNGSSEYWTSRNTNKSTQCNMGSFSPGTYSWSASACWKGSWTTVGGGSVTVRAKSAPVEITYLNYTEYPQDKRIRVEYKLKNCKEAKVYLCFLGNDYNNYEAYDYVKGTDEVDYEFNCSSWFDVTPGKKYKIMIRAFGNDGTTDYDSINYESQGIKVDTPRLTTQATTSKCTFSWNRPTGATKLILRVYTWSGSYNETKTLDAYNDSPYTWSGLRTGTQYRYEAYYVGYEDGGYINSDTTQNGFETIQKRTFAWSITPVKGNEFSITARDWNNMCGVINSYREIKGLQQYSFTVAEQGHNLTALMFNQVVQILSQMGATGLPNTVSPNQNCEADMFNKLASAINNMDV